MNTKTKVLLAFIFIFLAGFASGYIFNHAYPVGETAVTEEQEERSEHWGRNGDIDRDERQRSARVWLTDYLDLSDTQKDDFFERMSEYRSDIHELIKDQRSKEHDLIIDHYTEFRNEISSILNNEQLEKLDTRFHPDSVKHDTRRGPQREQRRGRN